MNKRHLSPVRRTWALILAFVLILPMVLQLSHRLWHQHEHPHFIRLTKGVTIQEHIPPCPINDYQISQFSSPQAAPLSVQRTLLLTVEQPGQVCPPQTEARIGYLLRAPPLS